MRKNGKSGQPLSVFLAMIFLAALTACAGPATEAATSSAEALPTEEAAEEDDHMEDGGDDHMEEEGDHMEEEGDHMEEDDHGPEEHLTGHDIPEEAAATENPIERTGRSVQKGTAIYASNCAVCHGDNGEGDGPTAESLDPPPADLHEDHVQVLSDGELFWVISHGVADTGMPPWDDALSEEERWHVVNYIRSLVE